MDASASPKASADISQVYGFFLTAIDNNNFPESLNQRNTIIKYTKLPDFEADSKASWPPQHSPIQPRVRRLTTIDDALLKTNRSLQSDIVNPVKTMATKFTKRKIVTITEDDENDMHPKFSKDKRATSGKVSSRSIGVDFKEEKQPTNRSTSRLTNASKYSREAKASEKMDAASKKELSVTKLNYRRKQDGKPPVETTKTRYVKEKEIVKNSKREALSRTSISKNLVSSSESEKDLMSNKNKLSRNCKSGDMHRKRFDKPRQVCAQPAQSKNKILYLKEIQTKNQPVTVIHVPLDEKCKRQSVDSKRSTNFKYLIDELKTIDRGTDAEEVKDFKDIHINTEPVPKTVDQITDMNDFEIKNIRECVESSAQTESVKESFDNLEIPNVTLTKDRNESKGDTLIFGNALPNLKVPTFKVTPHKEELSSSDISFCHNASYIISRATLTYTTRQKINFHVVGSNDSISSNQTPSPLAYPMNVVSVFKSELNDKEVSGVISAENTKENRNNTNTSYTNCLNELKSLNCSYIFNSDKLMKPSDIISTIRVNNGLLPSDYICEQFQRELNFIDSFFESLQYLESCSLSDKCFSDEKVENFVNNSVLFDAGFDVKNSEYNNFLTKIENGSSTDDRETMASKSLCLLNFLIRDEQRRAKNLLFVLKMREDALKDFTKSQILWLEKKKKHDNTDISTLKKKQRGALLKLQHECGEMQRMRKALLTLSEKRKIALMKTKKNIELKLKNNVDVEQIILGKKKLKRNTPTDRHNAPLKCFDLSSSGCEESTASRPTSEAAAAAGPLAPTLTSAEKCIQTGDSVLGSESTDRSTNTAAENFVAVDGGYLNILFHNLLLPQIFSSGKQYEVNEDALKNILHSANSQKNNFNGGDVEKLMEQIKNRDSDRSSSPSTARSLVDEFDQYYRSLTEEDRSPVASPDTRCRTEQVCEVKDTYSQTPELKVNTEDRFHSISSSTMTYNSVEEVAQETFLASDRSCGCEPLISAEGRDADNESVSVTSQTQTGPLPVPVGAAAPVDTPPPDIPPWLLPKSTESSSSDVSVSSQPLCASATSQSSLASPVQSEAEELRRQQLAIEREIKALEQQQCRLLVVREIPDKPPPPYTPPAEARVPKLPRKFTPDETIDEKIEQHISEPNEDTVDPTDPFDVLLRDFCQETLERHIQEQSDKPWDACNLLPQKPLVDNEKLTHKTSSELKEILTGAIPSIVSGFSSRRSDHIDDILFAEWRRCEPEWTTLHTDEAIVKNQLFESIFQKILSETIDEYRRTVQCKPVAN